MGKKQKRKRTKAEKGNDHRNVGYTALEALYEHNAEHSKNIYPPIITKVGLKEYTDEEIAEKSGRVISYNYNNRYCQQGCFKSYSQWFMESHTVHQLCCRYSWFVIYLYL